MKKLSNSVFTINCVLTLIILFLFNCQVTFSQWLTNGSNIYYSNGKVGIGTSAPSEKLEIAGDILANQYRCVLNNFDFSKLPRTQLESQSIKLFDDYYKYRPGGSAPGNNSYGTLLAIYGRSNHWEHNLYFGRDKKIYYRTSEWSSGTAEDGTTGGYHDWRILLDSKSNVVSSGILELTGNGNHYFQNGNVGIGTTSPSAKLEVSSSGTIGGPANPNYSLAYFKIYDGTQAMYFDPNEIHASSGLYIHSDSPSGSIKFGINKSIIMTLTNQFVESKCFSVNETNIETVSGQYTPTKLSFRFNEARGFNYNSADNYVYFAMNTKVPMVVGENKVGIGVLPGEMAGSHKLYVNGSIIATEVSVKLKANWPDYIFKDTYSLPSLSEVESFINENGHLPEIPSAKEVEENGLSLGEMNALMMKKIEELTLYIIIQNKSMEELKHEVEFLRQEKNNQ